MRCRIFFFVFMIFLLQPDLFSESKKNLAIFSFKANNTPASFEPILKDMFEVALYKTKYFKILERAQINMILQEHGLQLNGCTDQSCAVEFGKILSADFAAYGSISKLDKYNINFKVINISNTELVFTDTIEVSGEKDFQRAAETIADKIVASMKNKERGSYKNSDYYIRGIIPGWAQMYNGNMLKGSLFLGGFLVGGITSAGAWYYYKKNSDHYHNLGPGYKKSVYDKAYSKYYTSGALFYSSIGAISLIYILNWIDVIWFNDEFPVEFGAGTGFNDISGRNADLNQNKNYEMYLSFSRKF
jgi:hypothetical protein